MRDEGKDNPNADGPLQSEPWRSLGEVLADVPDAVLYIGADGTLLGGNPAAETLFGVGAGDFCGRPLSSLLPSELATERTRLSHALHGEWQERPFLLGLPEQGSRLSVTLSIKALRNPMGALLGFTALVRPLARLPQEAAEEAGACVIGGGGGGGSVTIEAKRAWLDEFAQLEEVDRLKSDFISVISHELRTPLVDVIGYSEFLLDEIGGPLTPESLCFAEKIQAAGKHLEGLVNKLLDFAQLEAGNHSLTFHETDLASLVGGIVRSYAPEATHLGLSLAHEGEKENVIVCADAGRLTQVISNLLDNALKFTPAGGRVRVHVRAEADEALVTVADTGPGIPPEKRLLLFKAFSQIEPSLRREHGGSGLGLSLCRAIVEAHHGHIGVDSEPLGGACFWFTLPTYDPARGMPPCPP